MSFADLSQADKNALACTYASLILHDGNAALSAANIQTLIKTAGLNVPDYYPKLWEKGLKIRSVDDIISSAGSVAAPSSGGSAAAAPTSGAAASTAAPVAKKQEKKVEVEEEEEDGGGGMGGLFGEEED